MAQLMLYDSFENEFGSEYIRPNERMYVRASVHLPGGDLDPDTGMLKADRPRRGRTQAKRMEYGALSKEYGKLEQEYEQSKAQPGISMSLRMAVLLVALAGFMMAILLLAQQGGLAQRQKQLNDMNVMLEEYGKANEELSAQIAEASDSASVCYAAVRDLGMIPAEAAQAVYLSAIESPSLQQEVSNQAQSTAVPALASAGVE